MTGPAELVTCDQTIDGTIRLRNCPFDRITTHHRQLVCGPNHAILQALTGHPPTQATLDPQPRRCCVVLTREGCAADSA